MGLRRWSHALHPPGPGRVRPVAEGGTQTRRGCRGGRSTGAPARGAGISGHHRSRRAQGEAARALRSEGAGRRAERRDRAHRRHRVRPRGDVRRADPHAHPRGPGREAGCATTASTPPPSARPPGPRSSRGGITTSTTRGPSWSWPPRFQGNTGIRPNSVTPLAQILRLNGYSTAAFGKYHETPPWEASVSGPYDRWPTGSGFDKFYGFIGGETNQWAPAVYDGVTRVETPHDPNYHFTTDMTDHAISWIALPAGADAGQAVLRLLRHRGLPTRRTTRPRSTSRSTRASSIRAGTSYVRRRWRGRSSKAWCRRARS